MKNLFLISIIIILSISSWSNNNPINEPMSKIIASIIKDEILPYEELKKLENEKQVKIIRNSIYAKHGYIFKSSELKNIFIKFAWYKEKTKNVKNLLTINDKHNLEDIQYYECKLKFNKIINYQSSQYNSFKLTLKEKKLIGIWQNFPFMAAGWSNTYTIYPNNKFVLRTNQMDCTRRLILKIGNWKLVNNELQVRYTNKQEIIGGEIINEPPCGKKIFNGNILLNDINPYEILNYKIEFLGNDTNNNNKPHIKLNNEDYWLMKKDPDEYN